MSKNADGSPKVSTGPASVYAFFVPYLRPVAANFGYALALHGSMANDLDLIAIPWTEEACDAETLVVALAEACQGEVVRESPKQINGEWVMVKSAPEKKPHGRVAYTIDLKFGMYSTGKTIDLSIMPRVKASVSPNNESSSPADLRWTDADRKPDSCTT